MSYHVKFSAKQNGWFIEADSESDDFGTSLYDTEQEAYDDLAQMVVEGLITQEEIRFTGERDSSGDYGYPFPPGTVYEPRR